MIDCSESRIEALFAIMDVDLDDVLIELYEENKIPFVLLTYGYGTAKSEIYEMLGTADRENRGYQYSHEQVSDFIMNKIRRD